MDLYLFFILLNASSDEVSLHAWTRIVLREKKNEPFQRNLEDTQQRGGPTGQFRRPHGSEHQLADEQRHGPRGLQHPRHDRHPAGEETGGRQDVPLRDGEEAFVCSGLGTGSNVSLLSKLMFDSFRLLRLLTSFHYL